MSAGDWKAMFAAACEGDCGLVEYYLQSGVEPNHQHPEFLTTALNGAIEHGRREVVALLLAHGADPNIRAAADERNAFDVAVEYGELEIAAMLRGTA